jgi:hypothetical protein
MSRDVPGTLLDNSGHSLNKIDVYHHPCEIEVLLRRQTVNKRSKESMQSLGKSECPENMNHSHRGTLDWAFEQQLKEVKEPSTEHYGQIRQQVQKP